MPARPWTRFTARSFQVGPGPGRGQERAACGPGTLISSCSFRQFEGHWVLRRCRVGEKRAQRLAVMEPTERGHRKWPATSMMSRAGARLLLRKRRGHVRVHPEKTPPGRSTQGTRRYAGAARDRPPILIRFADILKHRLGELHGASTRPSRNTVSGRLLLRVPHQGQQQRQVVERFWNSASRSISAGSRLQAGLMVMALGG